jgi:hypothetical protein
VTVERKVDRHVSPKSRPRKNNAIKLLELWTKPPARPSRMLKAEMVSYSFAFTDLTDALASSLTTTSPVFSP